MFDDEPTPSETRVHLNIKFGSNGSAFATVTAPTVPELMAQADELMDEAGRLNAVVEEIQARSTFAQQGVTTTALPPSQNAPRQSAQPSTTQNTGEVCAHGVNREVKTGVKNGRKWVAEFCTVKNDPNGLAECAPIWKR